MQTRGFPFPWVERPNIVPIIDGNRAGFSFITLGFLADITLYFAIALLVLALWKVARK
jgi:hypothetical protein